MLSIGIYISLFSFIPCLCFGQNVLYEGDGKASSPPLDPGRKISINASYRIRGERQREHHIKRYGTNQTENFLLARLRLDMNYRFKRNTRLHVQLQDARVLGHSLDENDFQGGNNPLQDPLDINQAFFEWQPFDAICLTIGRQVISFRDRRVFGPGNWGNTGRYVWDAATLNLKNRLLESNWMIGRFILHDPHQWPNRTATGPMAVACYTTLISVPATFDVFYVHKKDDRGQIQGESGKGDLESHSYGFWLNRQINAWDFGLTLAIQVGKWGTDDIQAMGVVFSIARTWQVAGTPIVQIQSILGSGDRDPDDGMHNTFDGIFGGADTDLYGWMNIFFWKNVQEYRINFHVNPVNNFKLISEYHYFRLDSARDAWYFPGPEQRRDKSGSAGRDLGHEIDLIVQYSAKKYLNLRGGLCFFVPGDFVRQTGPSPMCCWYFVETTISI